jgi:hypothetical protein
MLPLPEQCAAAIHARLTLLGKNAGRHSNTGFIALRQAHAAAAAAAAVAATGIDNRWHQLLLH